MPKFGFYQTEHRNNNFFSFIQKHAWEIPKRPLIHWLAPSSYKALSKNEHATLNIQSINSREFCVFCARLASSLQQSGIGPEDRVLIALPLSFQFVSFWFSLVKIGAVPVIIDEWWEKDFVYKAVEQGKCRGAIFSKRFYDTLSDCDAFKSIPIKITVGKTDYENPTAKYEELIKNQTEADTLIIAQDHPATVHFTRDHHNHVIGIKRDHKQMAAQQFTQRRYFNIADSEKILSFFPGSIINSLAHGLQTTIPLQHPSIGREDYLKLLLNQFELIKPTSLNLKANMLTELCDIAIASNKTFNSLNQIYLGLDGHKSQLIKKLKTVFPNTHIRFFFGTAEAEPISTIIDTEGILQQQNADKGKYVGKLDKSITCKILKTSQDAIKINDLMDWMEWEVPKTQEGEIVVAAEHVVRDYLDNKDAFEKNKIIDDFDITWHRTGILGHLDEENNLWVSGEK